MLRFLYHKTLWVLFAWSDNFMALCMPRALCQKLCSGLNTSYNTTLLNSSIIIKFKQWESILLRMSKLQEIPPNHNNLEYFTTNNHLDQCRICCTEALAVYNLHTWYQPRTKGGKPDLLTQRPNYHPDQRGISPYEQNSPHHKTLPARRYG
jgi:hypothetical protein